MPTKRIGIRTHEILMCIPDENLRQTVGAMSRQNRRKWLAKNKKKVDEWIKNRCESTLT